MTGTISAVIESAELQTLGDPGQVNECDRDAPCLHLCGCVMLPLGYLLHSITPQWDYIFGFTWEMVMLADLRLSIIAYLLAWKYGLLAAIWIFVVGTWWWYFLSRGIQRMMDGFRHRNEINTLKIS